MRRMKPFSPARPKTSNVVGVFTAQAAASRLSRLEFDVARLVREIDTAEARAERARKALARSIGERQTLLNVIAAETPKALLEARKHGA